MNHLEQLQHTLTYLSYETRVEEHGLIVYHPYKEYQHLIIVEEKDKLSVRPYGLFSNVKRWVKFIFWILIIAAFTAIYAVTWEWEQIVLFALFIFIAWYVDKDYVNPLKVQIEQLSSNHHLIKKLNQAIEIQISDPLTRLEQINNALIDLGYNTQVKDNTMTVGIPGKVLKHHRIDVHDTSINVHSYGRLLKYRSLIFICFSAIFLFVIQMLIGLEHSTAMPLFYIICFTFMSRLFDDNRLLTMKMHLEQIILRLDDSL